MRQLESAPQVSQPPSTVEVVLLGGRTTSNQQLVDGDSGAARKHAGEQGCLVVATFPPAIRMNWHGDHQNPPAHIEMPRLPG